MTPAEHHVRAEELDAKAQQIWDEQIAPNAETLVQAKLGGEALAVCDFLVRRGQVHATLATVRPQPEPPEPPETITGWLYCSCPRQGNRQMASFGRRVTAARECPIHGEET